MDLGKKLVDELGIDKSVDTLGRWMAHYIAELIRDAEDAAPEHRPAKLDSCASAILELWRHRAELPDGTRPFEDVEPILRALESLEPCNDTPRYFRQPRNMAVEKEPETEVDQWLKLADGIDFTARQLIRHCLVCASQSAQEKTEEWVQLVESTGLNNDMDIKAILD
ncbi:AVAST type 3 anti-phage proein Avs3b [Salinisphaera hydrothermalis]|uniref:AVAST type 3 anti-phage proein Avs3b n=1 Tax=Salinisphaera hydrothermalis TaxID=563188 RepID=UPI003342BE94